MRISTCSSASSGRTSRLWWAALGRFGSWALPPWSGRPGEIRTHRRAPKQPPGLRAGRKLLRPHCCINLCCIGFKRDSLTRVATSAPAGGIHSGRTRRFPARRAQSNSRFFTCNTRNTCYGPEKKSLALLEEDTPNSHNCDNPATASGFRCCRLLFPRRESRRRGSMWLEFLLSLQLPEIRLIPVPAQHRTIRRSQASEASICPFPTTAGKPPLAAS